MRYTHQILVCKRCGKRYPAWSYRLDRCINCGGPFEVVEINSDTGVVLDNS